jgi:hypothetical protein
MKAMKWLMVAMAVGMLGGWAGAELQLVENFETLTGSTQYPNSPDNQSATGVLGGTWDTESENTGNVVLETNVTRVVRLASLSTASGGGGRGVLFSGITNTIENTETGVLFFRFYVRQESGALPRFYLGMHTLTGTNPLVSGTCNKQSVTAGFGLLDSGSNGMKVVSTSDVLLKDGLLRAQWYNAWIVANNATDTFDLYIRWILSPGGAPTLPAPEDLVASGLAFTAPTTAPLTGGMFVSPTLTNVGSTRLTIDDIYWDGDQGLKTRTAHTPVPSNGATLIPATQILSWAAPNDPNIATLLGYDVYLDPNEVKVRAGDASVKVSSGKTDTSFDPNPDLLDNTPYFWRVDTTLVFNTDPNRVVTKGYVWKFTTRPAAPVIQTEPVSQVRGPANGKLNAEFKVAAVNATGYQWYKDNTLLQGKNTDTLSIQPVIRADEGKYYCVVSNTGGSIQSKTVWLEYARLTGQWNFEGDLADGVNGNNGTHFPAEPAAVYEAGMVGASALKLNGIDEYVDIPVAALPKAGTEFTIALWAKCNPVTHAMTPIFANAPATAANARVLNIHLPYSNGNVYFDGGNADAAGYDRINGAPRSAGTPPVWNHFVFTKDVETGFMRIYQNGELLLQGTNLRREVTGAERFTLGTSFSTPADFFDGLIDDLRIYNYALTALESAYLYTDASGKTVCLNPQDPVLVAYDFDRNCKVDLGDFAMLAAQWLTCYQVPDCVTRP